MTLNQEVGQFLMKGFVRKKSEAPRFSRQKIATDLNVSLSFVSQILSGKRALPPDLVEPFCEILDLDTEQKNWLGQKVLSSRKLNVSPGLLKKTDLRTAQNGYPEVPWTNQPKDNFWMLRQWYYFAILDVTSLKDFDHSVAYIARRLMLPLPMVTDAVEKLLDAGILLSVNGELKKNDRHIYFQSARSKDDLRTFHKLAMTKAISELEQYISDEDVAKRFMSTYMITAPKEKIEWAKQQVVQFMQFMTAELASETPDELYQLSVQFFPLTKRK
jgi:uncharacterized protein (TIGR02147 family)